MNQESVNKALYFVESGILSAEEDIIGGCEDEYSRTSLNVLLVCKEALEKQVAKKPTNIKYFTYDEKIGYCPSCECGTNSQIMFCDKCGQKLDWEE